MIKELAESIQRCYAGTNIANKLSGGFWYEQAPQGTGGEWAVFFFIGGSFEQWMGGADERIGTYDMQLNIYSDVDDGGITLAELIKRFDKEFNMARLTIDEHKCLLAQNNSLIMLPVINGIRQATLQFTIEIVKE